MTIPSSDEWSFAEFDVARRAYLDRDMAFDEMAKRIADLAVVNTGCIDPLRTENPEAPVDTTWRAWFTISVADEPCLSDLFYNGRDGVRGRYWQSAMEGNAATASIITLLREKLLRFAADNTDNFGPTTPARGDMGLVARSLDATSAKAWAYEGKNPIFNATPRLIARRWANNRPGGNGTRAATASWATDGAISPLLTSNTIRSASGSGCISKRTSMMLEEAIKLHRFVGISPEQPLTEAGRHCEAVVTAD